jgi:hypothetical protein
MMTDNESLSLREAVDYCGSGVTVREATRLRRLAHDLPRWAAGNHPRFGAAGVDAVTRAGRSRKVGVVVDPVEPEQRGPWRWEDLGLKRVGPAGRAESPDVHEQHELHLECRQRRARRAGVNNIV